MKINGTKASEGIVIGKAHVLNEYVHEITPFTISDKGEELSLFDHALTKATEELEIIKKDTLHILGEDYAMIIDAQIAMVNDPSIYRAVQNSINEESLNAAYAFNEICSHYISVFEEMDNDYIKERATDISDIQSRVLDKLLDKTEINQSYNENTIIVSNDISPSLIVQFDLNVIKGFAINTGSDLAHNAIIARSLELPGVVGTINITDHVQQGDTIILNGKDGYIIVNPTDDEIQEHLVAIEEIAKKKVRLDKYTKRSTLTKDGHHIKIQSNITSVYELPQLSKYNSEGIGLYRTEFLYMERDSFPTYEEQLEVYDKVLNYDKNQKVVIRTLDLGGDKQISFMNLKELKNPRGNRGIRFTLNHRKLFEIQLRAIFASNTGNLHLLLPFVSSVNEVKETLEIIKEIKPVKPFKLGIMVELPETAYRLDDYFPYIDFVSIGTNDLLQYTFGVDRQDTSMKELVNPFTPSFVTLLKNIIEQATINKVDCSVCGELAGNEDMALLLLGFGLKEFSMVPNKIPVIRELINQTPLKKAIRLTNQLHQTKTVQDVFDIINKIKAL